MGHTLLLHNTANLGLKSHVKHTIRLVQHQELDIFHPKSSALNEIDETTRRGHEQIAAALNLPELIPDIGPTVDDHRGDAGAVEELLRLVLDLTGQLAGGRQDEALGVGPPSPGPAGRIGAPVSQHGDDDGEEKSGRLAGAGLGAGHEVALVGGDGDAPLLHGRGLGVAAELHVAEEVLADDLGRVDLDGLGHVAAGGLHGDVVVVVEVDAGRLLDVALEELALEALVGPHVAVVAPLVLAGAALSAVAAAVGSATVLLDAAPARAHVALVAAAPAVAAGAAVISSSAASIVSPLLLGRPPRWRAVGWSATGLISQVRRNCTFGVESRQSQRLAVAC